MSADVSHVIARTMAAREDQAFGPCPVRKGLHNIFPKNVRPRSQELSSTPIAAAASKRSTATGIRSVRHPISDSRPTYRTQSGAFFYFSSSLSVSAYFSSRYIILFSALISYQPRYA